LRIQNPSKPQALKISGSGTFKYCMCPFDAQPVVKVDDNWTAYMHTVVEVKVQHCINYSKGSY